MKTLKCRQCGKIFEVDPDNPKISWKAIAAGAAIGGTVGSILPGVGTAFGAMIGAKSAHSAAKTSFDCPLCGSQNDINCS